VVQSIRARREILPLLAPAAALLLLHGLFGKALARYMVPLLPIVAVFAAAGATLTLPRLHPAARVALAAVLLAFPAWTSFGIVSRLARTDTRGELLRAFEDARLPRDAPVFSPGYPFYPFPLAWDQAYLRQETLAVTECETRRAIQRDVANELLRADRFPRLEISLLAAPLLQVDRAKLPDRFLLIVPEHFGGFDWWQDLRGILDEQAARQGHVVRSVLRIEPNGGRPLPPRDAYDAIDFGWWLPYPDATLVERPGPPIEVLLVEKR
jgi:hypothetical protein